MKYHIRQIASMTGGVFLKPPTTDTVIEHILLDSRQISFPATSLFFALKGRHFDGHLFLDHAYRGGIRHFIISKKTAPKRMEAAQFILVDNTLAALQQLAAKHRQQYPIPVIGITGSNGKTIVKEWLFQLLHPDYRIVRSPKSYNSQTGVPLSVLQLNAQHTLGIFEAGISLPAEMEKIAPIIAPQTGIFTNIGEAHSEGFRDQSVKLREKLKLFEKAHTLLYRCDDDMMEKEIKKWKTKTNNPIQLLRWSTQNAKANYFIENINPGETATAILIKETSSGRYYFFKIPFTDSASIENAIHCWVLMKHFGYANDIIAERMARLEHVAMRLELKEGHNGCTIINDSYNSDINSLKIALDFLS
ncbi:MAG TPA: bifunctional UDP-N-acetylmuramoyl-tripeptide:D-alanyl-D-alanine ligase/alanine racemase, partial [Bacteroidetes bacterium]|nr:bifunctional UDP-N-acetylmuramoyl-tripeptide:D-alanyl-D-alanine ligase/alanine racemase [Bacteroidota bacterium]